MKRPNIEDYPKWGKRLIDDLEKYIDFLESNQKEFVEYMNNRIFDLEGLDKYDDFSGELHVLSEALTKYKELNK